MSCWTIKVFAFKLKHFEFLFHPRVSVSLLGRWKGHSRGPVIDGAWHSPPAWCSLSHAALVGHPPHAGAEPGVPALIVGGKSPGSQSMSRLPVQIDDGNQSTYNRANTDLIAWPSLSLQPTQNCLASSHSFLISASHRRRWHQTVPGRACDTMWTASCLVNIIKILSFWIVSWPIKVQTEKLLLILIFFFFTRPGFCHGP